MALATAPLPAGVAVVRLSGPDAWQVAQAVMPSFIKAQARQAVLGKIVDVAEVLDTALALGFKAPASFTGEDVVELHLHGGTTVVDSVLALLLRFEGVRQALPGEFSRRAVLNGKMDLTEAEGIADLIAAQTDVQRRQALRLMQGELGKKFEDWRGRILALLAQVEAAIDFPDEELEVLQDEGLQRKMRDMLATLTEALEQRAGERVREGVRLAIIGKPNAGKSTLLNVLGGREVAIVSDIPGTTRDVVSLNLDIGGYPITVLDTAGLRATKDVIEAEGVRRARASAADADLIVAVVSAEEWPMVDDEILNLLAPERSVILVSKADLADEDIVGPLTVREDEDDEGIHYPVLAVNLQDDDALARLFPILVQGVKRVAGASADAVQLTRARHRAAVQQAITALGQALVQMNRADETGTSVAELAAHDLREAAAAIGTVTGRTGSEDVLDVVFSTFCIGK